MYTYIYDFTHDINKYRNEYQSGKKTKDVWHMHHAKNHEQNLYKGTTQALRSRTYMHTYMHIYVHVHTCIHICIYIQALRDFAEQ